jgi:adenine/guanine/hypoxanthine permease
VGRASGGFSATGGSGSAGTAADDPDGVSTGSRPETSSGGGLAGSDTYARLTPVATTTSAGSGALDRYFGITERGSSVRREVRGGLVTFMTMAYIVVLNPLIIGTAPDADGRVLGIEPVAGVTALVAAVMTIVMGVVGRMPIALATGLGLNAFLAVAVASRMSWADAMGLVVLEGLVITVLVLTGFRVAIFRAIPAQLKTAIAVGIGLFLALIGLVDAGIVRRPEAGVVPVQLGIAGNLRGWPVLVFVLGLAIMAILVARGVRGAILIGIAAATVLALVVEAVADPGPAVGPDGSANPTGWQLTVPTWPDRVTGLPDLSLVGDFSLFGGFERVGVLAALLLVFTLLLADFFDTMGTVVAVGAEAGLLDESGEPPNVEQVLLVDSLAAAAGGAASAASATSYVESTAGVADGARTGLASVVTGLLFALALFFTPLVSLVPAEAATPALVIVGGLLFMQVRDLDLTDFGLVLPAFLTMVLMPFTFSIANGIGAGFISYVVLQAARGRARDVHPLLWVVAALFMVYFVLEPLQELLGIG